MDETGIYNGNSLAGIKNIPVREKYATDNLVVRNIFLTHTHTQCRRPYNKKNAEKQAFPLPDNRGFSYFQYLNCPAMSAGAVTTSIAGTCDVRFLSLPVILLLASLIWVIIILSLFIVYYKCKLNTTREALVRYVCIYLSVKDFVPSDKRPVVNWMKDPVTPEEFIQIINRMLKRMMLLPLFILPLLPVSAQGSMDETASADSIYVFRFVPQKDMFYIPYQGNGAEMNRLRGVLTRYIDRLRAGQMYVSVSSYAASKNGETSARRMGYLRNSRIKSELITRTELTERMFVTDRLIPTPYNDSLRDVVVVVFPAGVEKVRRIAGAEAAEKVEAYIKEVKADSPEVREAAERERRAAVLRAEQEAAARREEAQRLAQQQAEQAEAERKAAEAERQRLAAEESARRQAEAAPYTVALRANLLRCGMAHQPPYRYSGKRHMDFVVVGQQEPALCLLESIARSALLYR